MAAATRSLGPCTPASSLHYANTFDGRSVPAWEAGIRLGRGSVVVDAVAGQWRHTEVQTFLNPVVGSPGGLAGTVDRIEVSRASLSFHGVGTIDVPIAERVSVYGAARLAVPAEDVGSSELQVTAGGRFGW